MDARISCFFVSTHRIAKLGHGSKLALEISSTPFYLNMPLDTALDSLNSNDEWFLSFLVSKLVPLCLSHC